MKWKRIAAAALSVLTLAVLCAFEEPASDEELYQALHGTWQGSFHVVVAEGYYTEDHATINFINKGDESELFVTVETAESAYVRLNDWKIEDGSLTFSYNSDPWTCEVSLSLNEEGNLQGLFSQYGKNYTTLFTKVSNQPTDLGSTARYVFDGRTSSEWLDQLRAYPSYFSSGTVIPFTYELGNKAKVQSLIDAYQVEPLMEEAGSDIERIRILLDAVCANVRHDGASGMPTPQDAVTVAQYSQTMGGVECRGLSIILSELCRAYGIPAKSIKCAPAMADAEYCHVIVHAYARDLGQWVMVDPTYHLMLQDESGNYLSIPQVRDCLIRGETMVPYEKAGRNGRPFYMDYYRGYMAQNMFHFSCALNAGFGTDTTDSTVSGPVYTLVPAGYSSTYAYYRNERPTYDAEAFWAAPDLPGISQEAAAEEQVVEAPVE